MIKNPTPILTPHIRSLAITRRGVMHLIEILQNLAIAHFTRIENELASFGVAGAPAADGAVRGVFGVAADVAYARVEEAFARAEVVAVHVFDAPEAAGGEGGLLGAVREGHGRCGLFGGEVHCGGCEGAHEAVEEAGHGVGAEEGEEDFEGGIQVDRW